MGLAALVAVAVQSPFPGILRDVFLGAGVLSLIFGVLALLPSRGAVPRYGETPGGTLFVNPGAFTQGIPPSIVMALAGFGYGMALLVVAFSLPL